MTLLQNLKIRKDKDKRDRLAAVQTIQIKVDKHWDRLVVPTFGGGAIVDDKREIKAIKIFAPKDTALERLFMNDPELREKIETAFIQTMVYARTGVNRDDPDNDESKFKLVVNDMEDIEEIERIERESDKNFICKPCRPVFDLKSGEMPKYFSQLIDSLYAYCGIKEPYQKWAAQHRNVLYPATDLPLYDQTADSILPRDEYFGPNKYFQGRNLLWRQKLVCAYLLAKVGLDYNTYAMDIPETYVPRSWKMEDFATFVNYTEKELCKQNINIKFDLKNTIETKKPLLQDTIEGKQARKKMKLEPGEIGTAYLSHLVPPKFSSANITVEEEKNAKENMNEERNFQKTLPSNNILSQEIKKQKIDGKKMKIPNFVEPLFPPFLSNTLSNGKYNIEEEKYTEENICTVTERKGDNLNDNAFDENSVQVDDDGYEDIFRNQLFNSDLEKNSNIEIKTEETNQVEILEERGDNLELFLKKLNMSNFLSLFRNEKVDLETLKKMSHSDLQMFGIKTFGDRFRIMEKLKTS